MEELTERRPSGLLIAARIVAGLVVLALVVPTLAITIARVVPGHGLLWVILRACAPIAIVTYSLAAVVLAVLSTGLRAGARSASLLALAVVVALLGLHGWWFAQPFLADAPGSATDDTLVVMSANLHLGRADPRAVLDAVDHDGADVVVLVEVTPSALASLDAGGLGQRLAYRTGSPAVNRDGIMVFSRTPLSDVSAISTASPGFSVETTAGGRPVRVLAVHPTAPNNGVATWESDLDAVLAAAIAARGPTIVAGDFNATLDHPPLLRLMGARYRDASSDAGLGWRPTWPSADDAGFFGARMPRLFALDHVFVRGPLTATAAHVRPVPGTDHRALVTRLAWTTKGA